MSCRSVDSESIDALFSFDHHLLSRFRWLRLRPLFPRHVLRRHFSGCRFEFFILHILLCFLATILHRSIVYSSSSSSTLFQTSFKPSMTPFLNADDSSPISESNHNNPSSPSLLLPELLDQVRSNLRPPPTPYHTPFPERMLLPFLFSIDRSINRCRQSLIDFSHTSWVPKFQYFSINPLSRGSLEIDRPWTPKSCPIESKRWSLLSRRMVRRFYRNSWLRISPLSRPRAKAHRSTTIFLSGQPSSVEPSQETAICVRTDS